METAENAHTVMNSAHVSVPSYNLTEIHGVILDTGDSLTHTVMLYLKVCPSKSRGRTSRIE